MVAAQTLVFLKLLFQSHVCTLFATVSHLICTHSVTCSLSTRSLHRWWYMCGRMVKQRAHTTEKGFQGHMKHCATRADTPRSGTRSKCTKCACVCVCVCVKNRREVGMFKKTSEDARQPKFMKQPIRYPSVSIVASSFHVLRIDSSRTYPAARVVTRTRCKFECACECECVVCVKVPLTLPRLA